MTRSFLIFMTILFAAPAFGQQFSFKMIFADAAGNRDTVILGYDTNGTNGIDVAFGEQNIISTPFNAGLNVRAGNTWWVHYATSMGFLQGKDYFVDAFINKPLIQTKKQVVENTGECSLGSVWTGKFTKIVPIIELDIKTNNWPVTAYWNSADFNDPCRNGSVFTDIHPGGWWDAGMDKFKTELLQADSFVFNHNSYHYEINGGTEQVPVYWLAFGDSSLTFDDMEMEWLLNIPTVNTKAQIRVYPNPATNKITVDASPQFGKIEQVQVTNAIGQMVISTPGPIVDISSLTSGIYFVTITNHEGVNATSRLLKE